MAFIQMIEVQSDDADALQASEAEFEAATEGQRTTRRRILCQDRNDSSKYVMIVILDSYQAAMEKSNLPGTSESAEKMAAVLTAPPVFRDLDVLQDKDN